MTPEQHLRWFCSNIEFFASISEAELALTVPTCSGWNVADLCAHMSFGLGVCYPIAAATPPENPADQVFVNADRSCVDLSGSEAFSAFVSNMNDCAHTLATMDPDAACWTYAGPGTAAFWLRRAAVETAVHRFDAELALGADVEPITLVQADDAIDETLTFAFELACNKIGAPASTLHIRATDLPGERSFGSGGPQCVLTGDAHSVLLALWGRHEHVAVNVVGDAAAANEWLTLVGRAFAGR